MGDGVGEGVGVRVGEGVGVGVGMHQVSWMVAELAEPPDHWTWEVLVRVWQP